MILRSVMSLLETCLQLRQLFQAHVLVKERILQSTPEFYLALTELAAEFERTRSFVETSLRIIARAGGFQHCKSLRFRVHSTLIAASISGSTSSTYRQLVATNHLYNWTVLLLIIITLGGT